MSDGRVSDTLKGLRKMHLKSKPLEMKRMPSGIQGEPDPKRTLPNPAEDESDNGSDDMGFEEYDELGFEEYDDFPEPEPEPRPGPEPGLPMVGDVLNNSHTVLSLHPNHADGFYTSMCILMKLRSKTVLVNGNEEDPNAITLRLSALSQLRINLTQVMGTMGTDRKVASMFADFLNGRFPIGMTPESNDAEYAFGMVRAMRMINKVRMDNQLGEFVSWSTGITETAMDEQESLLDQFLTVQANENSWPTMYEVEALASVLKIDIHLYFTSGNFAGGGYALDWNLINNPVKLGPGNGLNEPYRLLWSANHQMKFRPLIPVETASRQSIDCKSNNLQEDRDDLHRTSLHPLYYADNVWNSNYELD